MKETLNLSAWQRQTIADMGYDAWYLTPLTRPVSDETRAHDALINNLVGAVENHSSTAPPQASMAVAPPEIPAPEAPMTQPQAIPQSIKNKATDDNSPRAVGKIIQATTVAPAAETSRQRHVISPPPAIAINTSLPLSPPDDAVVFPYAPSAGDWDLLTQQAQTLASTAKRPCVLGQGNRHADVCFIFAPPTPPRASDTGGDLSAEVLGFSAAAEQLLQEMCASIGMDWMDGYQTRLLKQATALGQDPDAELLASHLGLLASEWALVKPKRLFLFGALVTRAVLATEAPLSALMNGVYALHYQTPDGTETAEVICLPDPDYLLALPSEKGKVWQRIKHLRID